MNQVGRPKSLNKKVPFNLGLAPQMYEALLAYREKTGVPMNEVIRRAIEAYLIER